MSRRALLALLAVSGLLTAAANAFDIHSVDVRHDSERYHLAMKVSLDAPAHSVYAVFTDLPGLPRVNPSIRSVQVLEALPGQDQRVFTEVSACVGPFCRRLRQVQDMHFEPRAGHGGRVHARIVEQGSDFRRGEASWDFRDCAGRTCLDFEATLEPAFWVPPLVGPWLLQRKLRQEAIETCRGLERLARAATPAP